MPDGLTRVKPVVPLERQIACVASEISLRRKVYPHWIVIGKMQKADADREIRTMEAVLDTLKHLDGEANPALSSAQRNPA